RSPQEWLSVANSAVSKANSIANSAVSKYGKRDYHSVVNSALSVANSAVSQSGKRDEILPTITADATLEAREPQQWLSVANSAVSKANSIANSAVSQYGKRDYHSVV